MPEATVPLSAYGNDVGVSLGAQIVVRTSTPTSTLRHGSARGWNRPYVASEELVLRGEPTGRPAAECLRGTSVTRPVQVQAV